MRAVVVEESGGPEVLVLKEIPTPSPQAGQVLIKIHAFGLNRAEMFTRQGHSPGVLWPRVIGIECVGEVVEAPSGDLKPGQRVAALMGGMGRQFDGGYAEYTCVPRRCVFPVETSLDWTTFGAIPEMFQTVHGSLHAALCIEPGQTLLIRGGTSSIGMTATRMARRHGLEVLATTRNPAKADRLRDNGVSRVIIDKGQIEAQVRDAYPDGVDAVLELVGTVTLLDSLRCATRRGVVCMTGILGNAWALKDFQPMGGIPSCVRLTSYSGGPEDLDAQSLQAFLDEVEAGREVVNIDKIFGLEQLVEAHTYMESNRATGKLVVEVNP